LSQLAPLAVAVPLVVAAVLGIGHAVLGRIVADIVAVLTAALTLVMTILLLIHVGPGYSVYWFGGWHPRAGVAIGVAFQVGAIGAGLAAFVSLLMVLALVYSTRFIGVQAPRYHMLMLTFMAGMVGFCLSGDLFNMFVLFELMSVSAVALIGYRIQQQSALEGALNFAVINMIGAFLFLIGIGLVYARTGALNLAQIGATLAHAGNDRVIVIAFTLIVSAFLIKAAVVPFHFWLSDAYAVALAPVCLLLAGAMSEIGLYGIARVYFSAFAPAIAPQGTSALRTILVAAGLITALGGAAMALVEDHLKRMLAFVTISFVGVFLFGAGLLSEDGVAGTSIYVLGDGFAKALLFACVGILQNRLGAVGQRRLHGRGRPLCVIAASFFAGGLLISALPPFGPFLGKSMIDDAALKQGLDFVPPLLMIISALSGAAVLRAGARVFLGWGESHDEERDSADEETSAETEQLYDHTPAVMLIPTIALLAGAIGVGAWYGMADLATTAAHTFVDVSAYRAAVFGGARQLGAASSAAPAWFDYVYCAGAVVLAVLIAALGLFSRRIGAAAERLVRAAHVGMEPIRRLHTGRVGDYAAALALGVGILAALMTLTLG